MSPGNMDIRSLIRPNLLGLKPYSSARAEYSGSAEIFLDANENPFPSNINRYPDPQHTLLKAAIARTFDLSPEQILIGNGSDEIIDMIIRTFCVPGQDKIRHISPSFGMYEVAAHINDVGVEAIPLLPDFGLDSHACIDGQTTSHKVLFLCSPNNPTGNSLDRYGMIETIKSFKGIVVIDEAYADFSDQPSLIQDLDSHPNLIVLRTFSKALGAAGLRIGYALASAEIMSYMGRIKPPYNVGSLVQKTALELWNHETERHAHIEVIKNERARIAEAFSAYSYIEIIFPSDANFLLVRFTAPLPVKAHLQNNGIIVRDRSRLPGCSGCLRITIGTPDENTALLNHLNTFE